MPEGKVITRIGAIEELLAKSKGVMPTEYYSENEIIVGQWIDKRPIYSKTVVINGPTSVNAYVDISLSSLNIDLMIYSHAVLFDSSGNAVTIPYQNGISEVLLNNKTLRYTVLGNEFINNNIHATIRYIKKNDLPVDIAPVLQNYSTEEQVVGTWIDGSLIYRKVIETTTNTSSDSYSIVKSNVASNAKEIIKIDARVLSNNIYYSLNGHTPNAVVSTSIAAQIAKDGTVDIIGKVANSGWANLPLKVILEYTKQDPVSTLFNIPNVQTLDLASEVETIEEPSVITADNIEDSYNFNLADM